MKKITIMLALLTAGWMAYATTSTKGETAHPVYKRIYTFE